MDDLKIGGRNPSDLKALLGPKLASMSPQEAYRLTTSESEFLAQCGRGRVAIGLELIAQDYFGRLPEK